MAGELLMEGSRAHVGGTRSAEDGEWKWERSKPTTSVPPVTLSGKVLTVGVTDLLSCFHLLLSHEFYDEMLTQTNLNT